MGGNSERLRRLLRSVGSPPAYPVTLFVSSQPCTERGRWFAELAAALSAELVTTRAADNDSARFAERIASALISGLGAGTGSTREPGADAATAEGRTTAPARSGEAMPSALVHAINLRAEEGCAKVIAVDCLERIDSPEVLATLALFIERLPPEVRLLLSSSCLPSIGVPRLLVRDHLLLLRVGHGGELISDERSE